MALREVSFRDHALEVLWEDGERVVCRWWQPKDDDSRSPVLAVLAAAQSPTLDRLLHEFRLRDVLDGAWAVQPLALEHDGERTILILEDGGGEPLHRLLGPPMEVGRFLRLAVRMAWALGKLHQCGVVHKDVKPNNFLVNPATGDVRLTGFGVASRLPRERQAPEPPERIAGTLAYMAPEQTGRMNRSIDSRADLYSLGITFFQMLTGTAPFAASEPMEWVHCHIARKPAALNGRARDMPAPLSAMVMKLLAKTAEDRYQTAGGVERDLRRCLSEWEASGRIGDFPPGRTGHSGPTANSREAIRKRTRGRDLLAAFDRVVSQGAPELVLVSGYSGIGKSRSSMSCTGCWFRREACSPGQVRPVQARHSLFDSGAGLSGTRAAAAQ